MRIPLLPTPAFTQSLTLPSASTSSLPPLYFIDSEPFLIELQGSLEMPGGTAAVQGEMDGVTVGKLDVGDPKKPVLKIGHHRLEGKLVTLVEPYALLRTTPAEEDEEDDDDEIGDEGNGNGAGEEGTNGRTPKRVRLSDPPKPEVEGADPTSSPEKMRKVKIDRPPKIEIVGLVRRKIVFSKRPEPMVILSSDIDGMHES